MSEPETTIEDIQQLEADRRTKRDRLINDMSVDPYGQRVDGLITLAEARDLYSEQADLAHKEDPDNDDRPVVHVAGRVMLHRVMGSLVFATLRDATGDLQIAVSKKAVERPAFKTAAKLVDLGDIVTVTGALAKTKTGEITVWAAGENGFAIATKSLAPPPAKWQGLQDQELRYRRRYVDLYANPEVMQTFQLRSQIIKRIRDFLTDPPEDLGPGFLEVETPMMQAIPGGAAAKPFTTFHNALGMELFMRIAPELYLKRLLVGGMPRVFEINRNFRNEGISPRHNPEFTMMELYQAFGDYDSMMCITERLMNTVAVEICGSETLPFGETDVSYALPFRRAKYHDLFEESNGFPSSDHEKLLEKARQLHIEDPEEKDHDLVLSEVWEETVETNLIQPTFVIDYPASLCPLTKQKTDNPDVAERFELYICGMELANAYTELNDPDVQLDNFQRQLQGLDEEENTFRNMDMDFVEALKVGMPPAGGLGIGIDRFVMLMTNHRSIRDVVLFPLMRTQD